MSNPYFSIIIPTYNRSKTIQKCLDSVLHQTFVDFEVLVIDNQSKDNTIELVQQNKDSRLITLINDKNYERCYSRNRGITHSTGNFILFLDSDDYFEMDHLQNWFDYLQNHLSKTACFFICDKKIYNGDNITLVKNKLNDNNQSLGLLKFPILPGQVCIPRNLLKNKSFRSEYLIFEDTALWLELLEEYSLEFAGHASFVYFLHEQNSVNVENVNFGQTRFRSLLNFKKDHPAIVRKIGKSIFKSELSLTLFLIAKHYMYKQNRVKAIYYTIKSLFNYPTKVQFKHRLLVLIKLVFNQSISEYKYKVQ